MEIRIKTHEEFKIDRMTVEIRGERTETESAADLVTDLRGQLEQASQRALNLDAALAESQATRLQLARELAVLTDKRDEAFAEARTLDNVIANKDMKIAQLGRQLNEVNEGRVQALGLAFQTESTLADAIAKLNKIRNIADLSPSQMANDIRAALNDESTVTE